MPPRPTNDPAPAVPVEGHPASRPGSDGGSGGDGGAGTPVRIRQTEVHRLASAFAEAEYELWVARPVPGVRPLPEGSLQVLYLLDATLFFGTAVEMTRIMYQLYGELPPLLVVGVAHPTESLARQSELRSRDFTPTRDARLGSFPGAPAPTLPEDRRMGRARAFLDFLVEEAVPFIGERYPVSRDGSVLWGSSLGGLFVLFAMLRRPEAFGGYIAASPAIWWDGAAILDLEEEGAARREDLPARLFMAVGGEEERADIPMLADFRLVTNALTMGERLRSRGYPSLELDVLVADGETHTTVVPVSLTRGLRFLSPARRAGR